MKLAYRLKTPQAPAGVALILVMLAILVLSVLAASIVFSARSETFASYNYRIATQADYVAKAGLQRAVNFFNSDKYAPVAPGDASTYYDVSQYTSSPLVLYNTKYRPVRCTADCPSSNSDVVLSVDSSGTFNGNYPETPTNADGDTIGTAFANRFFNISLDPLSSRRTPASSPSPRSWRTITRSTTPSTPQSTASPTRFGTLSPRERGTRTWAREIRSRPACKRQPWRPFTSPTLPTLCMACVTSRSKAQSAPTAITR